MPSTSLSATARSTVLSASLAPSVTVLWRVTLLEKVARGTVEMAIVRGTVASRRTAASVMRNDMLVILDGLRKLDFVNWFDFLLLNDFGIGDEEGKELLDEGVISEAVTSRRR